MNDDVNYYSITEDGVSEMSEDFVAGVQFERKQILDLIDDSLESAQFDNVDGAYGIGLIKLAILMRETDEIL